MKNRPSVYIVLLLVFLGSAGITLALPADGVLQAISAVPALGALFAALFQVFRDQAAFERQLLIQQQQQAFNLGAASHMASKAFDKHSDFCEKYLAEVHVTVRTLFREGPTQKALEHAFNLAELKRQYTTWLPKSILDGLEPFEAALRRIGASTYLADALRGTGDPDRPAAVAEMYAVFKQVMGLADASTTGADQTDVSIAAVEQQLRSVLGVDQLTVLRQRLMDQALAGPPQ